MEKETYCALMKHILFPALAWNKSNRISFCEALLVLAYYPGHEIDHQKGLPILFIVEIMFKTVI